MWTLITLTEAHESINFYTGNLYHTSEERGVGSISTHETEDLFQIKTFLHVKSKFRF